MAKIIFNDEIYNDDRMFVLAVCKCTISEVEKDIIETVIYHEKTPIDYMWAVVTYRNTPRYPITRVDHFGSLEAASEYMQSVESSVPLISLGGVSLAVPMSYKEFLAWKAANDLQEYDYRKVFLPGGTDQREAVYTQRRK